jgi:hypothetical protein
MVGGVGGTKKGYVVSTTERIYPPKSL